MTMIAKTRPDPERLLDVEWDVETRKLFDVSIRLVGKNERGVLAQVAAAVSAAEADITHIDMGNDPAAEITELQLLLSVRDRLHLADVMRTLKRSTAVLRVARVFESATAHHERHPALELQGAAR